MSDIIEQSIGTNESIVVHGDIREPDGVSYVRLFDGGRIRKVIECEKTSDGWKATLEDGREKAFSRQYLAALFILFRK